MHDPATMMRELDIRPGDVFLDLGCGAGDYSLRAADATGKNGFIYALDKSRDSIDALRERAAEDGYTNITGIVCDITRPLPIEVGCVDISLIATVLHAIDFPRSGAGLFTEIHRVLKPAGRFITIDCKKEEMPFGPPLHMRISSEEIVETAKQCGFRMKNCLDLGYNYMLSFTMDV
jgi:ubiquinone/menaquinone biosynthesis C-methylase UbiE